MGNFYVNYTLRGPGKDAVAQVLAGRDAVVAKVEFGIVVFDKESDEQNMEIVEELAARLSGALRCQLLAVLNHDDDILCYKLYTNGELIDDYDSAPGYFETSDEEAAFAPPSGGNAEKLCAASGSTKIAEVERILRKGWEDEDRYAFAFERHEALVEALGLSFCAVGVNFSSICDGKSPDLPEELVPSEMVRTKDLMPNQAGSNFDSLRHRPVPGYYKVGFRATPAQKSIPIGWMPNLWADLECLERDLSEGFQRATRPFREKFKQLGFVEQGFKRDNKAIYEHNRDSGAINYLDGEQRYLGQLLYRRHYLPESDKEVEQVIFAFTAVFERDALSFTNNMSRAMPVRANHQVVRLKSNDLFSVFEKFKEQLSQRPDRCRRFPDLQSLQAWFNENALALFEDQVKQGRWVRMSDYEVAKAQAKLGTHRP